MLLVLANVAHVICSCCYILFCWSCKLLLLLDFLHAVDADAGVDGASGQRGFDRGQFYMWPYLDASDLVKMVSKVLPNDIAVEAGGFQAEEEILDNDCGGDTERVKKRIRKYGSSVVGSSGARADQEAILDRLDNFATKMMGGSPSQGGGSQHTSEQ
jgi:hypothetical protein